MIELPLNPVEISSGRRDECVGISPIPEGVSKMAEVVVFNRLSPLVESPDCLRSSQQMTDHTGEKG